MQQLFELALRHASFFKQPTLLGLLAFCGTQNKHIPYSCNEKIHFLQIYHALQITIKRRKIIFILLMHNVRKEVKHWPCYYLRVLDAQFTNHQVKHNN